MKTKNKKQKTKNYNLKIKTFLFLVVVLGLGFFVFTFREAVADVPVREQQVETCSESSSGVCFPTWVRKFDKCTDYQTSLEKFLADVASKTSESEYKAYRSAQQRDIIKAREDINKLVATVYNELRTQQIAATGEGLSIDLRDTLQSLGIAVNDTSGNNATGTEELCKAGYYVKAKVGDEGDQCVAVAQEARFITNQDDFIYEEGRRRAMDMAFCYLGDWRHFPITGIDDPWNCTELGLGESCSQEDVWDTLGRKVHNDENFYADIDGKSTPLIINDDRHVHNLCEGLRALGKKCAQDIARDFVKYSTIDKIRRKDRTIILSPPQTWYTPDRCKIIEASLPVSNTPFMNKGSNTPYTKDIKSLNVVNPDRLNSSEFLTYYFGSHLGNPTLPKLPSDMDDVEYTIGREMEAINVPENSFSGLAAKTEDIASQIIQETTDLRKLQYTSGQGLRDATLRIGWKDYDWENASRDTVTFLGKYAALDSPLGEDPKKPNKIYKPLPCYWEDSGNAKGCEDGLSLGLGEPNGKTFYFDTGIVISPISITKSKLDAAIKAQFDLAQKAFSDEEGGSAASRSLGECGISSTSADYSLHSFLPAPWEDAGINLASSINPLTGDSYITDGAPSKDNISYRIPNLPKNYFNVIYNNVFQLYHTSAPDVLAKWFRLNDLKDADGNDIGTYNSIYGIGEPIDILAELGPGNEGSHDPDQDPSDPTAPPPGDTGGHLPQGCSNYLDNFQTIGSQEGVDACLLEGIAAAESSCRPSLTSGHGACGLMQILPKTASGLMGRTITCDELKSDPQLSIQIAAKFFKKSANVIGAYRASHDFDIGNQFIQTNQTVSYGGNIYDKGNDDLIASYNAGYGDGKKSNGQSMPFYTSSDCPNPKTPSWQCHINPGGFRETQTYVQRVQNNQDQCNSR